MEAFPHPIEFGPYKLYAKVAAGGMAEVFLATSPKPEFHNQFIAIKKLHPPLNANKPFVNLLIHEAKIGVLLTHPGIAEVYDLGSHRSEFFVAMEYVHGKSLDRLLKKIREGSAPPPGRDVASYIMFEVLRALAFAHALKDVKGRELNIVHRDISPGNILLEYKGNVKITDFGIATAENRLHVEFTNLAMGKLVYIPPEQAVNDPVHRASDLYSLSVVYYELLTGRLPFESENPSGLYREIVAGKFHDVRDIQPEISKELSELIHKNLDKSIKKRFQSAPEMFEAFHKYFLEHEDLDFNSRAIRAYFKKKLAEYLRRCFEEDIIEELEIIQDALARSEQEADLHATQPQEIPPPELLEGGPLETERTVFAPDHTHEATRHYPLTEDERKKILAGLPPSEAMKDAEEFEQMSPAAFQQQTVPEFKEARLSRAKEKLSSISISKDEREVLRHSEPAFEIINNQDLEAFEQNTFTGNKDKTIILTNEGLEAIENASAPIEDQSTRVIGTDSPQIEPDESTPQAQDLQVQTDPLSSNEGPASKEANEWISPLWQSRLRKMVGPVAGLLIIVGILFGIYSVREPIQERVAKVFQQARLMMEAHEARPLIPTQQIAIIFTGEADFQSQKDAARDFQFGSFSAQSLESFFDREYQSRSGKSEKLISFVSTEPRPVASPLSIHKQLAGAIQSGEVFLILEKEGFTHQQQFNSTIIVYTHQGGEFGNAAFPDEFNGQRQKATGLVFYAPAKESRAILLVKIAREVARLHGAKDRIDEQTLLPSVPRGLAEPEKAPMFPQTKAELMGRWILIDNLQKREISNLNELLIGEWTEQELGWPRKPEQKKEPQPVTAPAETKPPTEVAPKPVPAPKPAPAPAPAPAQAKPTEAAKPVAKPAAKPVNKTPAKPQKVKEAPQAPEAPKPKPIQPLPVQSNSSDSKFEGLKPSENSKAVEAPAPAAAPKPSEPIAVEPKPSSPPSEAAVPKPAEPAAEPSPPPPPNLELAD